jgi:hypothetical protein
MLEKSRLVKLLLLDEDVTPRHGDLQFEDVGWVADPSFG